MLLDGPRGGEPVGVRRCYGVGKGLVVAVVHVGHGLALVACGEAYGEAVEDEQTVFAYGLVVVVQLADGIGEGVEALGGVGVVVLRYAAHGFGNDFLRGDIACYRHLLQLKGMGLEAHVALLL